MRKTALRVSLALLLGVATADARPRPDPAWPQNVKAYFAEMAQMCRDGGGRMTYPDTLETADLTGDGRPDYFIADSSLDCSLGASFYTGNSGGSLLVFDGANPASPAILTEAMFGHAVVSLQGKKVLYLVVGGHNCGQKSFASRAEAETCERPVVWNAAKKQLVWAPVSAKRPVGTYVKF